MALMQFSNEFRIVQMAKAELIFRCLRADDPEFKRQRYEKAPDVVIENRQKG